MPLRYLTRGRISANAPLSSPRALGGLALVVFALELGVMAIIAAVQNRSINLLDLSDAIVLSLTTTMLFHLLLLRPLDRELAERLQALQQAEEASQHASTELRQYRDTLDEHAIVAVTDARGRIIEVNDQFCVISQYSEQELLGQDHRIVNSGYHGAEFFRDLWDTIRSGKTWHGDIRNRRKDGSYYWLSTTITPFRNGDGKIDRYVAVRTDISALKETEARLLRMTELLRGAGKIAKVGGWEFDVLTNELTWSEETCRIHEVSPGWKPDISKAIEFYAPESRPIITAAVEHGMKYGTPWDLELELITALGNRVWVRAQGASEMVNGRCVRLFGAFRDITDEKRAKEALRAATESAEAANRAKSELLATMSHEIRTPLGGVIGCLQVLLEAELNEDEAETGRMALQSARALLDLLNDVLDMSKIEAGGLELEQGAFELAPIVREVLALATNAVGPKPLRLSAEISEATPSVLGDPTRVRQVLWNLVGNALKFTPQGSIQVRLTAVDAVLRVSVTDTGIGIRPEAMGRLFQRYTQAEASTSRQFGGTGLGLAISKNLIERMHGQIGASSEPGVGSTFWFTLPIADQQLSGERAA
ncbi:MAG: PAS domain-containing protein [Candidatus Eisenbacteria bacterium]|nr:PAS domain-containing protein [Candidatus Eisenbacteria bacterium]